MKLSTEIDFYLTASSVIIVEKQVVLLFTFLCRFDLKISIML